MDVILRGIRPARKRPNYHGLTPRDLERVMFLVLDLYANEDLSAKQIATVVPELTGVSINTEQVHKVIREAFRAGWVWIAPPLNQKLSSSIRSAVGGGEIHAVDTFGVRGSHYVATAGAAKVYELIESIAAARGGDPVHLGLGIGPTTWTFVRALAALLRGDPRPPRLVVHGLAADFSATDPGETPLAFFGALRASGADITYIPMTTDPLLPSEELPGLPARLGAREAFASRDDIDIVVTSFGQFTNEHSYLHGYLARFDPDTLQSLLAKGCIGDVQLCGYGAGGPLPVTEGMQAATLFDIEKLVALAHDGEHHVVLLCGPGGRCPHESKTAALLPLLRQPSLRVWNHLVIDSETAAEVDAALSDPAA